MLAHPSDADIRKNIQGVSFCICMTDMVAPYVISITLHILKSTRAMLWVNLAMTWARQSVAVCVV